MTELERLRAELTEEQRTNLIVIWNHFRENREWIGVRQLHQWRDWNPQVRTSLEQLGGSIVFEFEDNGLKRYQLTFLGILLTEDGEGYERMLASYLDWIARKCRTEPTRTQVSSAEVKAVATYDEQKFFVLGFLIREGRFYSGTASFGTDEWTVGIPDEVVDAFPSDIGGYVQRRAMENYYPDVPITNTERSTYLWRKQNEVFGKEEQPEFAAGNARNSYIAETRIAELRAISPSSFDLTRLIRMCEELNICFSNKCYLATIILTRALIDHVPPVFGAKTFAEVVQTYKAGSQSFVAQMGHLDKSCRKIADANLHTVIRSKEILPNETQVNFSNDLDVLLAEIVRILR